MNGGEHIFLHPVGFPISVLEGFETKAEWLKSCPYYDETVNEEWAEKAWDIVKERTSKSFSDTPKMSAEKKK